MKKQSNTSQNPQGEQLFILNKRKPLVIFLTVYLCISIILYPVYIILYLKGVDLTSHKLPFVSPTIVIIIAPIIMLLLSLFLFKFYYLSLYKLKTGKFNSTE